MKHEIPPQTNIQRQSKTSILLRVFAHITDQTILIIGKLSVINAFVFWSIMFPDNIFTIYYLGAFLLVFVEFLYYTTLESDPNIQATLGKKLFRLKVLSRSGQSISFFHSSYRFITKYVMIKISEIISPIIIITILNNYFYDNQFMINLFTSENILAIYFLTLVFSHTIYWLTCSTVFFTKERVTVHDLISCTRIRMKSKNSMANKDYALKKNTDLLDGKYLTMTNLS